MTYTREQLENMSDFEVNKALCLKLGLDVSGVDEQRNMMTGDVLDFCQIWGYIMPLAIEHGINLTNLVVAHYEPERQKNWIACENLDADWDRVLYSCGAAYDDDSPQRAIACCLLMMELK